MSYTIIVNPEHVRAVKEFIPVSDVRPALNGLHVELQADQAYLVASDGHILVAYHHPEGHNDPERGPVAFTVPKELFTGLKARGSIAISYDAEQKTCNVMQQGTARSANAISDRYPEWRRVIPTKISGEAALYDPELMVPISRAAKHLGADHCYVTPNGLDAGAISFGKEEIFGVIMPLRAEMMPDFPAWCR